MNQIHSAQPGLHAAIDKKSLMGRIFNWIPLFLLAYPMLIAPFISQFARGDGSENNIAASQSNVLNQLFWLGLIALTILSAGRRLLRLGHVLKNPVIWCLAAYLGLAVASVAWSPVPGIAFRRVVLQTIIVLCIVVSVSLTDDGRMLLVRLVRLMTVIVLVNIAAVALLPPTPLGYAGIYPQKNGLGAVMALAFIITLYGVLVFRGWRKLGMMAASGIALSLLVLSQSKTSLGLAVLLPVVAYCVVGMAYLLRINAAILLFFGALTGLVSWLFFSSVTRFDFTDLSILLFNDETFTGRTVIWEFVADVISRAPFFGQGYASFWGIGSDSIVFREAPGFVISLLQAHNGYMDATAELGFAGLSLLVLLIVVALAGAARIVPRDRHIAFLCYTLMLFTACHNLLESSWFRGYATNWLIFLIFALIPRATQSKSN